MSFLISVFKKNSVKWLTFIGSGLVAMGLSVYIYYFQTTIDFTGTLENVGSPLILFDFDGVICDSYRSALVTMNQVLEKHQYTQLDLNDIERYRNFSTKELIEQIGIPKYKILPLSREWRALMQQEMRKLKPFQSFPETLMELKSKGYSMGIVTSNSIRNVDIFLKNNRLDVFDFIFSGTGLWAKNDIFDKITSYDALRDAQIYYVGDEARDIIAGKKSNIPTIAVSWGFQNAKVLSKHLPHYVAHDVITLKKILLEISKKS